MKYTSKREEHDYELPPGPSLFGTQRHFYTEREQSQNSYGTTEDPKYPKQFLEIAKL